MCMQSDLHRNRVRHALSMDYNTDNTSSVAVCERINVQRREMNKMIDENRINDTLGKMAYHLETHNCISVSISGGSDSDCILHMICKNFPQHLHKVHFVFADTGLEYTPTREHLKYLEEHYNIKIERVRGMPIPLAVRKYGQPFVSKYASENIKRLQKHGFQWEDESLADMLKKYERCLAALKWYTNSWGERGVSYFNINRNKGLKKFLISNPPEFEISSMCCTKSKKEPMAKYENQLHADLTITGERKVEGGIRAAKTSCFGKKNGIDHYKPLFFWDNDTKSFYKEREGIRYSDCYEVWGFKRTGCVGCPFALKVFEELDTVQKYDPKVYKACMNVFGQSYEYTKKYREFKDNMKGDK